MYSISLYVLEISRPWRTSRASSPAPLSAATPSGSRRLFGAPSAAPWRPAPGAAAAAGRRLSAAAAAGCRRSAAGLWAPPGSSTGAAPGRRRASACQAIHSHRVSLSLLKTSGIAHGLQGATPFACLPAAPSLSRATHALRTFARELRSPTQSSFSFLTGKQREQEPRSSDRNIDLCQNS